MVPALAPAASDGPVRERRGALPVEVARATRGSNSDRRAPLATMSWVVDLLDGYALTP